MPLDFGREWFYNSRREQIETRLKWIRNSTNEVGMRSVVFVHVLLIHLFQIYRKTILS